MQKARWLSTSKRADQTKIWQRVTGSPRTQAGSALGFSSIRETLPSRGEVGEDKEKQDL